MRISPSSVAIGKPTKLRVSGAFVLCSFSLLTTATNAEVSVPPSQSAAEESRAHPCTDDPRGAGCKESCTDSPSQPTCAAICTNESGVSFCREFCAADTDLPCMDSYREGNCDGLDRPVFAGPMWRIGGRLAAGWQTHDQQAGYLGIRGLVGARVSSGMSLIARLHLGLGLDDRPQLFGAVGFELGAEGLIFDVLSRNSAIAVAPSLGFWVPGCGAERCPFALPSGTVELSQMWFGTSTAPAAEVFQATSLGIEAGLGYDPFLELWIGRVGATFGLDWSFF